MTQTVKRFQDLGLVDPYDVDCQRMERYLEHSNRIAKISGKKSPVVPKYKSDATVGQLPIRAEISERLAEIHRQLPESKEGNWDTFTTKLRSVHKRRHIEIDGLAEDFHFTFPKNFIADSHSDWYHWMYALELTLRDLVQRNAQYGCSSTFRNWFIETAYVRTIAAGEPKQGGHLCLATLELRANYTGRGLSSFLFGALQEVALRVGVPFQIESAQPRLGAHLHRLGWLRKNNSPLCTTWIDPATVPMDSWIAKHLIANWGSNSK